MAWIRVVILRGWELEISLRSGDDLGLDEESLSNQEEEWDLR